MGAGSEGVGTLATVSAPAASQIRRRLAWGGLLLVLAGVAAGLGASQEQAKQQLNGVLKTRADIAQQFVTSYIDDVFSRQQSVAGRQLAGATVDDSLFRAVAQSFGFTAAVILDDRGTALNILPPSPTKIGTNLAKKYAHLRSAVQGVRTVSHVVPSAALARPVVAFAVPYATPYGRRVFSGGFDVNASPVATYLNNAVPLAGAAVYLVDHQTEVVVADKAGSTPNAAPLSAQAPQLAKAASGGPDGSFSEAAGGHYFVQRDVLNSPWRIVLSVPDATLYAPLAGGTTWAPWAILVALALATVAFGRMLIRLQESRGALAVANADLALLARVDKLTGAYNRLHIEEQLDAFLRAAAREGSVPSLLMLDVDHFKKINDTEGHAVGDRALQCLATVVRAELRPGDVFGRWGGEEFVVLLPGTDVAGAAIVGERLRRAVAEAPVPSRSGGRLRLTMSVGFAAAESGERAQDLVARADVALYRAKRAGRNTVAA